MRNGSNVFLSALLRTHKLSITPLVWSKGRKAVAAETSLQPAWRRVRLALAPLQTRSILGALKVIMEIQCSTVWLAERSLVDKVRFFI